MTTEERVAAVAAERAAVQRGEGELRALDRHIAEVRAEAEALLKSGAANPSAQKVLHSDNSNFLTNIVSAKKIRKKKS